MLMKKFTLALFTTAAIALSSCDIPQDTDTVAPGGIRYSNDALNGDQIIETGPSCYQESFQQPEAERTNKLDILFVLDTSASLFNERARVAHRIDHFIKKLPKDTHYRLAVLLAHGKRSPWSGKLYYNGIVTPTVFDSKLHSVDWIRINLKFRLMFTPYDYWSDGGETAFYSLHKLLEDKNLERTQKAGFLRSNAALSVVFVSDENEICAKLPEGVTRRQDGDRHQGKSLEQLAAEENCTVKGKDGQSKELTPSYMLERLREFKGTQAVTIGAITHTTTQIKNLTARGEDEYGYGYMDIVKESKGVAIDIKEKDYAKGLAKLGQDAALSMTLYRRFVLRHNPIEEDSLAAQVDGVLQADVSYAVGDGTVFIPNPGTAKSKILIDYCLKSEGDDTDDGGIDNPNDGSENDDSETPDGTDNPNNDDDSDNNDDGTDDNNDDTDNDSNDEDSGDDSNGDPGNDGDGDLPDDCTAVSCPDIGL